MADPARDCPDCQNTDSLNRRNFLKVTAAGAAAVSVAGSVYADTTPGTSTGPETMVKTLFDSLSETQRQKVCFAWDHQSKDYGLLRTHIANNWNITEPMISSDFYTADQQAMVRKIFEGIIQPDWHQADRQATRGRCRRVSARSQSIAHLWHAGQGNFEFVMTGRHMTLRCDGNSTEHVAFGGPIFYGHAASGFNEKPNHPGNVFWHQALAANKVYDHAGREAAASGLVEKLPDEEAVGLPRSQRRFPGIAGDRNVERPARSGARGAADADRAVSSKRPGRSRWLA